MVRAWNSSADMVVEMVPYTSDAEVFLWKTAGIVASVVASAFASALAHSSSCVDLMVEQLGVVAVAYNQSADINMA